MLPFRKHSTENPCTYFRTALSLTCENISQTVAIGHMPVRWGLANNLLIIYKEEAIDRCLSVAKSR